MKDDLPVRLSILNDLQKIDGHRQVTDLYLWALAKSHKVFLGATLEGDIYTFAWSLNLLPTRLGRNQKVILLYLGYKAIDR